MKVNAIIYLDKINLSKNADDCINYAKENYNILKNFM